MPPRRSKRRRDNDAADDAASAVVAAAAGPAAAHDVADDAADDVAEANAASSRDDDGGDGNDDDGAPRCVVFSFLPFPRPPARPPARAAIFVVRRQFPWRVGKLDLRVIGKGSRGPLADCRLSNIFTNRKPDPWTKLFY